jgi:pimeloyl-ACP methyl ester carboxylesterase
MVDFMVTASRGFPHSGCLAVLSATAAFACSTPALGAESVNQPVFRQDTSELRFKERYQAGKVPVVFIHGLLGSPDQWSVMIDCLSRDPEVRVRFQLATFRYDSLQSIPESASQLENVLDNARRRFDPEGRDHSFAKLVLVGHSMGGLVAKATSYTPHRQRLELIPVQYGTDGPLQPTPVGRYVFVATPHRGAPINRGAVRSVGSWFARRLRTPSEVPGTEVSSVDELAWEHPLLVELERYRAAENVPFHSIIAALGNPLVDGANDGVVPVASARLAGARSEVIVQAQHFCLQQPDVIREVRRILVEHSTSFTYDMPNLSADRPRLTRVTTGIQRPVRSELINGNIKRTLNRSTP